MKYFLAYFHCPENLHKVDQRTLFQISTLPPSEDPNSGNHKIHMLCSNIEMGDIRFLYYPTKENSICKNKVNRGFAYGDVLSHNGSGKVSSKLLNSSIQDCELAFGKKMVPPNELTPISWRFIDKIGQYRFGIYNEKNEFLILKYCKYLKAISGKAFVYV